MAWQYTLPFLPASLQAPNIPTMFPQCPCNVTEQPVPYDYHSHTALDDVMREGGKTIEH